MARRKALNEQDFHGCTYVNEDDLKASTMSIQIDSPQINHSIRDKSCIVFFPRGITESRLNRNLVEELMSREWGDLFNHVLSFGNIDFSRKWIFHFDNNSNNDRAVAKEIFINGTRVKTIHATRKFNILKIDYVPLWIDLDDLGHKLTKVKGISGQHVDSRWGRGDKVTKDSTQVIMRFYKDANEEFDPPQYIHFYNDYNNRVFLHLSVIGQSAKCRRCNQEGHNLSNFNFRFCNFRFCYKCGKLVDKHGHICLVESKITEKNN